MADQPDYSDGVTLALYPPAEMAHRLAIPEGTPPDEFHVTVAYLGHADQVDREALLTAARGLQERLPVVGQLSGHAVFTGGARDVLVALVDSADLEQLRRDAVDAVTDAGIPVPSEHGYTAHMTLKYLDEGESAPLTRLAAEPVVFGQLAVVHGTERVDLPFMSLETAITPYVRTAYAQGWAASGGPMTDAVKAGCIAVMEMCSLYADDPKVLEVAIHLGHLEGIWAKVFERRYRLIAQAERDMLRLWKQSTADLDVEGAVTWIRQQLGVGEAVGDFLRRAKAVAREAAMRMFGWLTGKTSWQDMRDEMRKTVISGRAEGYADAIGVASAEQHLVGFDFDIAFEHAYSALENLGETWAESDAWLERMIGRAADEFGRTLGDLAASGADYSQMVAAGMDVLQDTVSAEGTVGFITDWALSAGMSRGALDLYRSEQVERVTWMTAGDGNVCPTCEKNGQDSPFAINDFPNMPAHPRCRCVASADFTVTPSSYGGFFG